MALLLSKRFFDHYHMVDAMSAAIQDVMAVLYEDIVLTPDSPLITMHDKKTFILITSDGDPDFFIEMRLELDDASEETLEETALDSRHTGSWLCYIRISDTVDRDPLIRHDWNSLDMSIRRVLRYE